MSTPHRCFVCPSECQHTVCDECGKRLNKPGGGSELYLSRGEIPGCREEDIYFLRKVMHGHLDELNAIHNHTINMVALNQLHYMLDHRQAKKNCDCRICSN